MTELEAMESQLTVQEILVFRSIAERAAEASGDRIGFLSDNSPEASDTEVSRQAADSFSCFLSADMYCSVAYFLPK